MHKLRRVVSNTVISLLGQGVTWISTLLLTMAYGRFLGDIKFGELYFATTFVLLMGIPIYTGYDRQATRDVAQEPDKVLCYFSNVFLIKLGFWLVIYSLTLLLSWFLGYSMEVRMLIGISGLTLLSSAIGSTFASLHYALEQAIFPVIGSILEKILSTFFGILLLRNGSGVQVMALVLLGGSLVGVIWQAICFYRRVGTGFIIDVALIRKLIRTNIPFLIYGVLSVIYYNIDAVLLSFMTNTAVVGWYGAAYRLFDTLTFLPNLVISTIMYPIFSKLSITSESDLKVAVEKSMNFLLFCGIPITVALIVLAPNIISFLYYRTEFTSAIPALQALSPGLIFLYINTALGTTILSKRQDRKIPIMAAIALVFNLVLNLIVIPLYQHIGAAIVTSLTELLLLFIAVVFIPKHLLPLGSLQVGAKALLASLVMAAIIWHLRAWNIFALVSTATLLYLGVAMLLKTIPSEDMRALYRALGSKV